MRKKTLIAVVLGLLFGGITLADEPVVVDGVEWVPWDHPDGTTHWYAAVHVPEAITWHEAMKAAEALTIESHLATVTSVEENALVFGLVTDDRYWLAERPGHSKTLGPWIGGFQVECTPEPACGWRWVTDEPFDFTAWRGGEPNNGHASGRNEDSLHYHLRIERWNDIPNTGSETLNGVRGLLAYVAESVVSPLVVPFEFTSSLVTLTFRDADSGDHYRFGGALQLGDDTNGIDLLNEDVTVNVGTSMITIPAGSFDQHGFRYSYEGTINGATVRAEFEDLGGDSLAFSVQAESVDLTGTSNPVAVSLHIGNDVGETTERLEGQLSLKSRLCDPCADWKNHGEYVSCVTHAVKKLVTNGILTEGEASQHVSAAARSSIGKKRYVPAECQ